MELAFTSVAGQLLELELDPHGGLPLDVVAIHPVWREGDRQVGRVQVHPVASPHFFLPLPVLQVSLQLNRCKPLSKAAIPAAAVWATHLPFGTGGGQLGPTAGSYTPSRAHCTALLRTSTTTALPTACATSCTAPPTHC